MYAFDYVAFDVAFDVDTGEPAPVSQAGAGWYPMFTPAPFFDEEEEIIVLAWRELNNYYG